MTAAKKFWIVTAGNLLVVGLLVLVLYGMMLAFAAIAPEISSWPLFTVVLTGVVLSVVGLRVTRPLSNGRVAHATLLSKRKLLAS